MFNHCNDRCRPSKMLVCFEVSPRPYRKCEPSYPKPIDMCDEEPNHNWCGDNFLREDRTGRY